MQTIGHGAHALIKKDGKFLILKRASHEKAFPDYWDLPGGGAEINEQPYQTAEREAEEEAGIDIEITGFINSYCAEYMRYWAHASIFEAEYVSGEITLSDEHSDFKWVTWNELKEISPRRDTIDNLFNPEMNKFINT
ncbi:MAG TPA: NUDIX domain-containing protein [Candidatus Dojkabacteria bacterium]|jgi:8-oxo-dGTP diphosphatase